MNIPSRVTVVGSVYFQPGNGQPADYTHTYCYNLISDEEPFQRTLEVGPEWVPLKGCWLESASEVMLRSLVGQEYLQVQEPEVLAEDANKVVEVCLGCADIPVGNGATGIYLAQLLLPPGRLCRFTPAILAMVRMRCQHGTARIQVSVLPS